jgi:hypothetical protein
MFLNRYPKPTVPPPEGCLFRLFETEILLDPDVMQASDRGRPSLESVCTIAVKIEDINDNAPIFDRAGYEIPVAQVREKHKGLASQDFRYKIEDINDNAPIFDRAGYEIPETQIKGNHF